MNVPTNGKPLARAAFNTKVLDIDCKAVVERISEMIREAVGRTLHRRGVVVAVSGGVDSSVCAVLAAKALGAERVHALLLPEADSAAQTTDKGKLVCGFAGIEYDVENITPTLQALGCYRRRDEAIRRVFPEYADGYRQKITLAENLLGSERVNYFNLVVESPAGLQEKKRMPVDVYLQIVAATNMKQRTRKLLEYYHAERLNYAVVGTPNRLEYDLGFFVRGGDGLADVKPIAHLYKTQVYALARYLGLPDVICNQTPSTDTYSLPQTQEEFYFALSYDQMDLLLYAFLHDISTDQAGAALGLQSEQVQRAYRDIVAKQRAAERLSRPALLVEQQDVD
ncbi:MAG: NAD(+) synthase [Planctomycetes bacterium]|nr:NAD(+) synthase [Planctomycetota bacterium]